MERIICDSYYKKEKHLWTIEPENPNNKEFNRRILAVNHLYSWLYDNGVLEKVSFWFRDYEDKIYFALDVDALLPYRKNMEHSKVTDAALAVHHNSYEVMIDGRVSMRERHGIKTFQKGAAND